MTAPAIVRFREVNSRAWRWWAVGASPVPVREDGSKAPTSTWKQYTEVQPTEREMAAAFQPRGAGGRCGGFGLVLGVSGLECLETEDAVTEEKFVAACHAQGHGALIDRVTAGYADRGPGGGVHRIYRVEHPVANTKLASRREYSPKEAEKQRAAGRPEHDAQGQNTTQVLIETRGQGGFIICAPSGGPDLHRGKGARYLTRDTWQLGMELHAPIRFGGEYTDVGGAPESVAAITDAERDTLYAVARTLDEMPAPTVPERTWTGERAASGRALSGETVGDWVNRTFTWPEVMEGLLGWTPGTRDGDWLRPGDTNAERSAVADHGGNDRLTIFSSAVDWAPTPAPGSNYPSVDKFGAITRAEHGGDFTAAARWVHANYPEAPGSSPSLPPGWRWAIPSLNDVATGTSRMERVPLAALEPDSDAATAEELDAFIASYTRFTRPTYLGRRTAWMRQGPVEDLPRHAHALVSDVLAGYYPASRAVTALRDALRARGADPAAVRDLLAHALGSILNSKVAQA